MNLSGLILKKTEEDVNIKRTEQFPGFHRCSSVGWADDCLRHLCLRQLCPEKMERDEGSLIRRMQEGNKQEGLMREDMVRWGFKIKEPIRRTDESLRLTGEPDNFVLTNGDREPTVLDYKSSSPNIFRVARHYETSEDMRQSKFHWIRHYPAQMQMYLYLFGFKDGMFLFKNKDSGEYHPINTPEDKSYQIFLAESLREVNGYLKREDAPKAVAVDACGHCGFKGVCFEEDELDTSVIAKINDPYLIELLSKRDSLVESKKEFDRLDKEAKTALKGQTVIVGDFLFKTGTHERVTYKVPEEIKKEYADTIQVDRVTIKNLKRPL